jgi:hypothetical protein
MLAMSKLELPINFEFLLVDHNKKHKFTINISGDTYAEIIDNANKLRIDLIKLYSKENVIRIADKVTFQSGEELPRT